MAIKKFIKDMFSVEVEEEVSPDKNNAAAKNSNVTQLEETRRHREDKVIRPTQSKAKNENVTDKKDEAPKEPFFKKDKEKPSQNKKAQPKKETTLMDSHETNAKVHLFEPRVFSETQDIADELKNERATLVNLSKIDSGPKKRIVDFLSGTVYALDGDIQKVGSDIFLCTPNSVRVEGEITGDKELNDDM
ncbi:cell division protein SepF [Corticicoccus populi]|uniref:Cell division protein SepF n=1 Tax=Corticicoccus populi TaxID=1812821 RepID=A0ABW5WTT3_9STAP